MVKNSIIQNYLREMRTTKNITQAELAKRAGVSTRTVERMEGNIGYNFNTCTFTKILKVLVK